MRAYRNFVFLILPLVLSGCGAYFSQPLDIREAREGETFEANKDLKNLPAPSEQLVAAVYKFRDQTGQYKPTGGAASTFSTAVSQGSTSILIKALEDSGWFIPIERENVNNLLNERQIIRSTRQQYADGSEQKLPPLLYAGILLEGGVISYDSNILTGGAGARYFGVGGSAEYRQDRITVYLRAVSTSNGKILKTVYISKTILSQSISASFFKYVRFKRLLEVETGITRNEPIQMALTEAIEKAVEGLITEGLIDNIWSAGDSEKAAGHIARYQLEKKQERATPVYGQLQDTNLRSSDVVTTNIGGSIIDGDLGDSEVNFAVGLNYRKAINPYWGVSLGLGYFGLSNNNSSFDRSFYSLESNLTYTALPHSKISPFVYLGAGIFADDNFDDIEPKLQYGLGLEYLISNKMGLNLFGEQHFSFSDTVDGVDQGKRNDFFWKMGLGLSIYF